MGTNSDLNQVRFIFSPLCGIFSDFFFFCFFCSHRMSVKRDIGKEFLSLPGLSCRKVALELLEAQTAHRNWNRRPYTSAGLIFMAMLMNT